MDSGNLVGDGEAWRADENGGGTVCPPIGRCLKSLRAERAHGPKLWLLKLAQGSDNREPGGSNCREESSRDPHDEGNHERRWHQLRGHLEGKRDLDARL